MPADDSQPRTRAIEKMVRPATARHERCPVPDAVYEHVALQMWSAVRRLLGEGTEVSWEAVSEARLADYCEAIEPGAVIGVFRFVECAGEGLVALDAKLVDAAVEALLGGGRLAGTAPEPRERTMIDQAIAARFIRLALDALARALLRDDKDARPLTAELIGLESNLRLLVAGRRDEVVAKASFQVSLGSPEDGGHFDLLLTHGMLEPAHRKLSDAHPARPPHGASEGSNALLAVLPETPITLHAVVDRLTLSLAEIAEWREGTLLPLGVAAERPVVMYGEREDSRGLGRKMFVGRLGASQGRKAVRILEVAPGSAEPIRTEAPS